jgi:alkyl sulfatase BDS1-like metallo-beta-lactamase superfamily hydrolase
VSEDTVLGMPVGLLFDYAAIHIIGEKAAGLDLRVNVEITDLGERWTFWVRNGVLNARMGAADDARLTVSGPKAAITGFLLKPAAARQLAQAGKLELKGDETVLDELAAVMDEFDPHFNMVTP